MRYEPLLRDIASQILVTLGYTVESVISGELAVKCLEDNKFDLIVIDMLMGTRMNGRQTYEKILSIHLMAFRSQDGSRVSV